MSHRILIVDAEEETREALKQFLQSLGYQVDAKAEGEAALESAMKKPYDLYVISSSLPDSPGHEIFTRLKTLRAEVQAIFLIEPDESDDVMDFLRFSVPKERVLDKPIEDLPALTRLIINILGPPVRS